jgi:broad specificity phosphatase PhoE
MAVRLLLVAHGLTAGMREMIFGDLTGLARPERVGPDSRKAALTVCGPEPACRQTATRVGGEPALVLEDLAGPNFGSWRGRSLAEVAAAEPNGVQAWLTDPAARPHGGESLHDLIERVGGECDGYPWPEGASRVVLTPLASRALLVHAVGAPPDAIFRIDVGPLGRAALSRSDRSWRLSVR